VLGFFHEAFKERNQHAIGEEEPENSIHKFSPPTLFNFRSVSTQNSEEPSGTS
jgi:hypothetical protein